ncbi:MAG: response regulator [Bdellovibrionales bacterium]|nr:response regulator [Bdellovibrionales bacterium]
MKKKILIVDDEEDLRELFSQVIKMAGHEAIVASGGKEAFELFQKNKIDAVLTDIRMPKGDGVELLVNIKDKFPETPVFIMSGYNDYSLEELLDMGASKVYVKPFNYELFLRELEEI